MCTLKRFFNIFVIFVIFLNTQMDLFILKTNVEKFNSTNEKTLHSIFNPNLFPNLVFFNCFMKLKGRATNFAQAAATILMLRLDHVTSG